MSELPEDRMRVKVELDTDGCAIVTLQYRVAADVAAEIARVVHSSRADEATAWVVKQLTKAASLPTGGATILKLVRDPDEST